MPHHLNLDSDLAAKYGALVEALSRFESLAIAFSGGVDSTLLLKVAHDTLGARVIAVSAQSPSVPAREIAEATAFCQSEGIEHIVVETHEFDIEGFDHNPPDRCYYCKREILSCIQSAVAAKGIYALAEGSNLDDEGDYRPGFKAVQEKNVLSPLRDAGFYKADVRALARHLGLSAWNKPAFACLNTRFAYGDLITPERLLMVDRAEEAVREEGITQVRVRMQGSTARIEVPEADIETLIQPSVRKRIVDEIKRIGFSYVSLDLQGYRTGSMNETL